jgi:hypothetical protein
MHWNHYRSDAPHDSDQWATTDRGWLHIAIDEHPDVNRDTTQRRRDYISDGLLCAGNYLHYPGRGVHASAYFQRVTTIGSVVVRIPMECTVFDTPEQAAAAVESAIRAALLPDAAQHAA